MNILALDLATKTGWAIQANGVRESGVQDFAIRRGESTGMLWLKFRRWLDDIAMITGSSPRAAVGLIVYEQPFVMRSGEAAAISVGMATRVQEFCALHGVEHTAVNGSTLKKWTTGSGGASKKEMITAVMKRFGVTRLGLQLGPDEADALALLEYAKAVIVPQGG